jgi:hypothetical protein
MGVDHIDDRAKNGRAFLLYSIEQRFEPRMCLNILSRPNLTENEPRASRYLPSDIGFAVGVEKDDDVTRS